MILFVPRHEHVFCFAAAPRAQRYKLLIYWHKWTKHSGRSYTHTHPARENCAYARLLCRECRLSHAFQCQCFLSVILWRWQCCCCCCWWSWLLLMLLYLFVHMFRSHLDSCIMCAHQTDITHMIFINSKKKRRAKKKKKKKTVLVLTAWASESEWKMRCKPKLRLDFMEIKSTNCCYCALCVFCHVCACVFVSLIDHTESENRRQHQWSRPYFFFFGFCFILPAWLAVGLFIRLYGYGSLVHNSFPFYHASPLFSSCMFNDNHDTLYTRTITQGEAVYTGAIYGPCGSSANVKIALNSNMLKFVFHSPYNIVICSIFGVHSCLLYRFAIVCLCMH